ncbi:MAG: sulfotransferase family protein [Roseiflexaceae bacterium]
MSVTRFAAVLGMHRSGTSAVTRALNLMGVTLPGELMHNTQHNTSGHWEALDAVRIHDALFAANDYTWDDPLLPFDICTRNQHAATAAQHDIASFVGTHVPVDCISAIKDPRICHTLPLWLHALSEAHITTCAIIMVRNPLEVAASLTARDCMPQHIGLQLWLRYMLAAEQHTRNIPRVVVHYDKLIADWRGALAPVCALLDIALPAPASALAQQLDNFLSTNERHHTYDDHMLTHVAADITGVITCYSQCLTTLATPDAHAVLDTVRNTLITQDAMLPSYVHEAMRYRTRQALHEIATLKADVAWRTSVMQAAANEIAWRKSVMIEHKLEP